MYNTVLYLVAVLIGCGLVLAIRCYDRLPPSGLVDDKLRTPRLDGLSSGDGAVVLRNYYVQHICTPTRSVLLSGRYQIHTGLQHATIHPAQPNSLYTGFDIIFVQFCTASHGGSSALRTTPSRAVRHALSGCHASRMLIGACDPMVRPNHDGRPTDIPLVGDHLRALNYSTHMCGKWHVGFYTEAACPWNRGFDTTMGYLTGSEVQGFDVDNIRFGTVSRGFPCPCTTPHAPCGVLFLAATRVEC